MGEKQKVKVGLISCSGEEIAAGTLSRTAVRLVLEKLRPDKTVTICLPLFLAGETGERNFAKNFPVVTVDGCHKLCAKAGTERYSGPVEQALCVSKMLKEWGETADNKTRRNLDEKGWRLAERIAEEIAEKVDQLLETYEKTDEPLPSEPSPVCSCMCGIQKSSLKVNGKDLEFIALPQVLSLIAALPDISAEEMKKELVKQIKLYNGPQEVDDEALQEALYQELLKKKGGK